jgi:hypothetical protein
MTFESSELKRLVMVSYNQMLMGGWFTADFNLINELVEMIIFMLSFM